jgi:ribosomal protein L16
VRCSWLIPKAGEKFKSRKGRPRVATGGSTRGTTVIWGDYGLRLLDKGRRISAAQLKVGEETIRKRLRGTKFRLYTRVVANIGVYTSGNDQRMGKGKGSFDHWATRVAVSRIIFELSGDIHEQIVKDAFRLAGNKMPGKLLILF